MIHILLLWWLFNAPQLDQILLWWLFNAPQLDQISSQIISNPEHQILVSSATGWEIATKYRIGKLPEAEELINNYAFILAQARFVELPISNLHAVRAGLLPIEHRDPFDRMLMAQAELENIPIITHDLAFSTGLIEVIPKLSQFP